MAPALHPAQQVPNLTNDNAALNEQCKISPVADVGVRAINTITCAAAAAIAQGDWFQVTNQAGEKLGLWLDKNANGTEPAEALYTALDAATECDIITGDTAAGVAVKVKAAIEGDAAWDAWTVVNAGSGVLVLTEASVGEVDAPVMHNAAEDGDGSFVAEATHSGTDSVLPSTYLTIRDDAGNKFHCWMNPDALGTDPAPASSTAVEIAFAGGAGAEVIAAALQVAVDALAEFECNLIGTTEVQVRNRDTGNHTDAADEDTGFTVTQIREGLAAPAQDVCPSPGSSPVGFTNNPSVI